MRESRVTPTSWNQTQFVVTNRDSIGIQSRRFSDTLNTLSITFNILSGILKLVSDNDGILSVNDGLLSDNEEIIANTRKMLTQKTRKKVKRIPTQENESN
jgi:hypothetical protein